MTTASQPIGLPRPSFYGPLAVFMGLNFFSLAMLHRPWDLGEFPVLVAGAWVISQTALYALWVTVAPVPLKWRLASVPIAILVLWFAFFGGVLVAQCACGVVMVWGLLISGFRLVQVDENEVPVSEPAPWQFDLKRLLVVMTGTCVVLAVAAALQISAIAVIGDLIAGVVLAGLTFPAILALLIPRRAIGWGALVFGVGLGFGMALDGITSGQGMAFTFLVVLLASEMFALHFVRRCGYRLRRAVG